MNKARIGETLLALALGLGITPLGYAMDASSPLVPYTTTVLGNGLTVVVKEAHAIPLATVNIWVGTGSVNEPSAIAGISHLIEHMYFKGTETRPVGVMDMEIKALGGYSNAATDLDSTNYIVCLPSDKVDKALEIQADALLHSTFDPGELDKEKGVILEEMRMRYDEPQSAAYFTAIEDTFSGTPYGNRLIGTPESLSACDREKVIEYLGKWYVPNNMVISIAGDVDTEAVTKRVCELFGGMKPKAIADMPSYAITPAKAGKTTVINKDVQLSFVLESFIGPGRSGMRDLMPLSVASTVLGGGKSSRLYRKLVTDGNTVLDVSATYDDYQGLGSFMISSNLPPTSVDAFTSEVKAQLADMAQNPVTEEELNRARMLVETSFDFASESGSNIAAILGSYELYGSAEDAVDYIRQVRAVTAADVMRVAREYLSPSSAITTLVNPKEAK